MKIGYDPTMTIVLMSVKLGQVQFTEGKRTTNGALELLPCKSCSSERSLMKYIDFMTIVLSIQVLI